MNKTSAKKGKREWKQFSQIIKMKFENSQKVNCE